MENKVDIHQVASEYKRRITEYGTSNLSIIDEMHSMEFYTKISVDVIKQGIEMNSHDEQLDLDINYLNF